jgi:hypothetical protein
MTVEGLNMDSAVTEHAEVEQTLLSALREKRPLVLLLGQDAWGSQQEPDPIVSLALAHLGRDNERVSGWPALLNTRSLPDNFYEWLAERFSRRPRPKWLEAVAGIPWSAVFTSSIDPELRTAFQSQAREPQPILTASEIPPVPRSTARTPIYYLYGRAGLSDAMAMPPTTKSELRQRSILQAIPMLNRLSETATPLGTIFIDGFNPDRDWLAIDALLAVLEQEPAPQIVWCGWPEDKTNLFDEAKDLLASGRLIVSNSRLGAVITALDSEDKLDDLVVPIATEPGKISFGSDQTFSPLPELRIRVEAVAAIVDDSWLTFQAPLGSEAKYAAFRRFHGDVEGARSLVRGIRSGFAITRDFEERLWQLVSSGINDHSRFNEPIVLHGQSGTGKSIALARLVARAREDRKAAVLYSTARIPQSADIDGFCEAAEQAGALVTLIVCDCNAFTGRYRELRLGLRSRGRRAVLVGSSYRHVDTNSERRRTFVHARDSLSDSERHQLALLVSQFTENNKFIVIGHDRNVLATLYRSLPQSRHRLSVGLGQEARSVEEILRDRGRETRPRSPNSKLAEQLISAGFAAENDEILNLKIEDELKDATGAAGRVIDFVMAAGRLNCPIP